MPACPSPLAKAIQADDSKDFIITMLACGITRRSAWFNFGLSSAGGR